MDTQNTVIWVGILLSAAQVLFTWFLFSLGLRKILKKLHWKNVWMAWIPGARFFALGNVLEHTIDGILCGVLDVLNLAISLINVDATSQGWSVAIMLLHFVVYIALFVFRIRLFMRILRVFERKNYWIVFFLLLESLTILILGFGKKYQPKAEFLQKAEAEQEAEERAEAESCGRMGIFQCIADEDTVLIMLEDYLLLQNHTTHTIGRCRYLGGIKFTDVLVSVRTEIVALILVESEVELSTMLDDRTIE